MGYDYDLLVIGAGPAGLAAALRARWLRRDTCVPCSVLICDPAGVGGLVQMGATFLTGPSWARTPHEMLTPLMRDLERFEVPVARERVTALRRTDGGLFEARSASGRGWRVAAAVVATGMKVLSNEPAYFGRGLEVTCMSYAHVQERMRSLFSRENEFPLVFVGSAKLVNLMALTESLRAPSQAVTYVIEGPDDELLGPAEQLAPGRVVAGWVERYGGEDKLAYVEAAGRRIPCARAVVDSNSYELRPACPLVTDPLLRRSPAGFVEVDRSMATSCPGLFAAGDVSGLPAAVTKALGEGVVAGFGAYRYVYRRKFGADPSLFAYLPTDGPLDAPAGDIPEGVGGLVPMPLVSGETLRPLLARLCPGRVEAALAALGARDPQALRDACGGAAAAEEVVRGLIREKVLTVHYC